MSPKQTLFLVLLLSLSHWVVALELANPTLNSSTRGWWVEAKEKAKAQLSPSAQTGGLTVDVQASSDQGWHAQLLGSLNGKVMAGEVYEISFTASANTPGFVKIYMQKDRDNWSTISSLEDLAINPKPVRLSCQLSIKESTDSLRLVLGGLATKVNTYDFRDFSLRKVDAAAAVPVVVSEDALTLGSSPDRKGAGGWRLETNGGAQGTMTEEETDAGISVTVESVGKERWHVQLMGTLNGPVQEGDRYRLTLTASSTSGSSFSVGIARNEQDWSTLTEYNSFWVGGEAKRVTCEMLVSKSANKVRLVIGNLGEKPTRFQFSNLSLVKLANAETGDAAAIAARQAAAKAARTEGKAAVAAIDPMPRQTVKGWGTRIAGREYWDTKNQDALDNPDLLKAYYGMGVTFVRVNAHWDADANYPDSPAYTAMRNKLKTAAKYGVTNYILTVWSPPRWAKTGNETNGFLDQNKNWKQEPGETTTILLDDKEDDFVAWYIALIKDLDARGHGLPLMISIQNEPNHIVRYEGAFYTPEKWARVTKKMRAALDVAGLEQIVIGGPDENYTDAAYNSVSIGPDGLAVHRPGDSTEVKGYLGGRYFQALADDPELDRALGAYAFHGYSYYHFQTLREGIVRFPKDCWMTESSDAGGNSPAEQDLFMIRHFISDMVSIPNNYWCHFADARVSKETKTKWALIVKDLEGTIHYSGRYYFFNRLWNIVRPGWRVHQLHTNSGTLRAHDAGQNGWINLDMVSFRDAANQQEVVILANQTDNEQALRLVGLLGDTGSTNTMHGDDDWSKGQPLAITHGTATVTLPPGTVTMVTTYR